MTLALLGALAVLALIDSTSFGTLLIPIWLMLAPGRLRPTRLLIFLGTVAAFYFVLGALLTAGVNAFSDQLKDALDTKPVQVVQLALGIFLLVMAFHVGRKKEPGEGGRVTRWRQSAMSEEGSTKALMSIADVPWPVMAAVLAGYCVVMVAPALVLLAGRILAQNRIEPLLRRVNDWMIRNGAENTAWILGIIGFILAGNALEPLGVLGQIDRLSKN